MFEKMELKATLEQKISKSGNPYECVVIQLTDDYKKIVFLDQAELALIKSTSNVEKTTNPFEFN